jgi:hypothetical protein
MPIYVGPPNLASAVLLGTNLMRLCLLLLVLMVLIVIGVTMVYDVRVL